MNQLRVARIALAGLALSGTLAAAQDAGAAPAQPAAVAQPAAAGPALPWQPKWSDPALEKIGTMLTGSWRTDAEVGEMSDRSRSVRVMMHIAPVVAADMTDTLYVESARADAPHRPYRQAIFQLYKYKDGVRLRTLEFHKSPGIGPAVVGLWAAPEAFPQFSRKDLIATIDLDVTPTSEGYTGKTPYPYPTAAAGAVEMTSEFTIGKDALVSADRGYGADGKIIWGASEGERFTLKRFEPSIAWKKLDGGVMTLDLLPARNTERLIENNDSITVHYSGWLFNNGAPFDSSRDRGQPASFQIGTVIPGWNEGMIGAGIGTVRRLVIPAEKGYGARGAGRVIPPNATLAFEVEVMDVQKPEIVNPAAADSGQPAAPAENAPAEAKPAETKPAETKPAETKPAQPANPGAASPK